MTGSFEGAGGGTAGDSVTARGRPGRKMSASGSSYDTAWIHRADRSATVHKMGYEN